MQQILPPDIQLKKRMVTEIGVISFYDNFIVFEAREGVVVSYKTGFSTLPKVLVYMGTKRWVFISNRVNSYSINPVDYKYFNKIPFLRAVAIVYYNEITYTNAQLEGKFCKKPFNIFNNLIDAFSWGKGFLK